MTTPVVVAPADPHSPDVAAALTALTAELAEGGYSAEQTFGYSVADLVERGVHLVAARVGGELAGVGGVEVQADGFAELKRFWVDPRRRGSGVADAVMTALLEYARRHGVTTVRLETGDKQAAAIRFYTRLGFEPVDRFPPYEASETSVCLQRRL
jgi:putative acetyltransferase